MFGSNPEDVHISFTERELPGWDSRRTTGRVVSTLDKSDVNYVNSCTSVAMHGRVQVVALRGGQSALRGNERDR